MLMVWPEVPDDIGRLAIMQPYFFPYAGHFSLLHCADHWVVFDVSQYTPKTWINRNRILHPKDGCMYATVPVRGSSQSMKIEAVMLHEPEEALRNLLGKLAHYRKRAPYYGAVVALLEKSFVDRRSDSLVDLNVSALSATSRYLGIDFSYSICSEVDLDLEVIDHPGQWALKIAQQLGARQYVNPISGRRLFRPEEFAAAGIELRFLRADPMVYDTGPYCFIPDLSILDVLMWNGPGTVREHLERASAVVSPDEVFP